GSDEPIDGFIADDGPGVFAGQASGDLLGRPAAGEPVQDEGLQVGIAQQPAAAPAPGFGLLAGIGGLVGERAAAIAFQLPRDARWRAIQSCRDLPDRFPGSAAAGNLAPFLEIELLIASSHRNTPPRKCCTSFVNLGGPGQATKRWPGIPAFAGMNIGVDDRQGRKNWHLDLIWGCAKHAKSKTDNDRWVLFLPPLEKSIIFRILFYHCTYK